MTSVSNPYPSLLWSFAILACATAVPAACGSDAPDNQDATLVTETPDTVQIDSPSLLIGESASPDDDFIFPLAAGVDHSGHVYVFDARTLELLRFSPTGALTAVIAKRGGGPGELTKPTSFLIDSASVGVWEDRARRYTTLSTTGRVLDEVNLGLLTPTRVATVLQAETLGEFILASIAEVPPHPDSVRGKDSVVFLRVSPAAGTQDTLYSYERPSASLSFHSGRTRILDPGPRLGPMVLYDAQDPGFIRLDRAIPDELGVTEFRLRRIAVDGTLLMEGRFFTSATAMPEQVRDSLAAFVEALPIDVSGSPPLQVLWPAYYPPVAGMLLSKHGDGRIWLELPPADRALGSTWIVLDRELRPVLHVRLPSSLQYPIAAGPFIAGTVEGEDGTRVIHTFRIPGSVASAARN